MKGLFFLVCLYLSSIEHSFAWRNFSGAGNPKRLTGQFIFSPSLGYITNFGNFGGLTGADGICQSAASSRSLPGNWKAVLSDEATNASTHVSITGPVYNLGGAVVATDATQFWSGNWTNPSYFDEKGTPVTTSIRTGTVAGGARRPGYTCSSWTSASSGISTNMTNGATATGIFGTGMGFYCAGASSFFCISDVTTLAPIAANRIPKRNHVIFATSATTTGNMGGIVGADALCQSAATGAGLSGTYVALLCVTGRPPSYFANLLRGGAKTVNGSVIAYDRDQLFQQTTISTNLIHTETGGSPVGFGTHSGCTSAGDGGVGSTCSDWTIAVGNNSQGSAKADGYFWKGPFMTSFDTASGCSQSKPILCLGLEAQ